MAAATKPFTFAEVRYQISGMVRRNPATRAQLDYLAALIVKLANEGKIRWERHTHSVPAISSYTVYRASEHIERLKRIDAGLENP